jgi:hypothetical protein
MPIRIVDDDKNFTIQRSAIAKNHSGNLQSLAALMPPQDRQLFLKKLFHRDAARFEKLLAELETAPSWVAAHRLIDSHFGLYQINPYHNEAIRFSDLVYKRYFP